VVDAVIKRLADRACKVARFRAMRALYQSFGTENTPDGRARKLLREWLSPEQREQFDKTGHFEVIGGSSGKKYRIFTGTGVNVLQLDDQGQPAMGLCFVPAGHLAVGDVMLAQKIALEACEASVITIANWFPPHGPLMARRAAQQQRLDR
jgi:hypothetical protein